MSPMSPMSRLRSQLTTSTTTALLFCLFALLSALYGCNKGASKTNKKGSAEVLLIAPEDLFTVHSDPFAFGPAIAGSIQPERKADLRAEVSSVVLQVLKDNGESVKKGDLLVRLDDTSIRDGLTSAQEAERAAELSLTQAQRQYERYKTLKASGMVSTQSLEDAESKRNNAQSSLADAKVRTVQARQQLQRTEIRAPFDGVVSERRVSNGDTAQIGKELLKVIDPASMRFEGLISADTVNQVKVGQKVSFRINGYPGKVFKGVMKHINPQANQVTRQVEVIVDFVGAEPEVSGLYAEGQVETSNVTSLAVPETAVVRNGDQVIAWTVKNNAIHKNTIKLGQRDANNGNYSVTSGLNNKDVILRIPNATLVDGQKIQIENKVEEEE